MRGRSCDVVRVEVSVKNRLSANCEDRKRRMYRGLKIQRRVMMPDVRTNLRKLHLVELVDVRLRGLRVLLAFLNIKVANLK